MMEQIFMDRMFKIISLLIFCNLAFARTQVPFANTREPQRTIKDFGTYRAWSNGTYESSCNGYKNPTVFYKSYTGATGNGVYRIKPSSTTYDVY